MSRASVLLAAITSEPTTTSDLYDRIGYAALTRVGLIPYQTFRDELVKLSAAGLAFSDEAPDGSTVWWRKNPNAAPAQEKHGPPARPSAP